LATYRCDQYIDLQVSNYGNGSQNTVKCLETHAIINNKARPKQDTWNWSKCVFVRVTKDAITMETP
jgi:hypothetical protein